jgi:peptidyl-prolyl cis-trans isomerase D
VNSVSNIFSQPDEKYIVAVLTDAREEGFADLEQVRGEITLAVKKQKKAEVLVARLNEQLEGVTDLTQFGLDSNQEVGEVSQVKFANTYISGIGLEPYIVGVSMYLPPNDVSEPLVGENGVFILSVIDRTEPPLTGEIDPAVKSRLTYSLESRSNYEAYNALMEAAQVEDNRLDLFYN